MKLGLLLFYSLCFIAGSCKTSGQKNRDIDEIRTILKTYNDCLIREDFNSMVDFIYPEIFKRFSQEEMTTDLKKSMHNDDYNIVVKDINIDSISNVVVYESKKYSMAKTRTKASFIIKGGVLNDSLRQKDVFNHFCSDFKKDYGEDNVNCDNLKKSVTIIMRGEAYLIFNTEYKKWFILSDTNPKDVERFIPDEVRRKLGIQILNNNN